MQSRSAGNLEKCTHYERRAIFVTPCCDKLYMCHNCHDESENHILNKKKIEAVICTKCDRLQNVRAGCIECKTVFGLYVCLICNIFDDVDKAQYHCEECGICRVGGRENYFHCKVCGLCLSNKFKKTGHKCVRNISNSECPVCLEDMHTSREILHVPKCGHLLHKKCFDELTKSGHSLCPVCKKKLEEEPSKSYITDSESD